MRAKELVVVVAVSGVMSLLGGFAAVTFLGSGAAVHADGEVIGGVGKKVRASSFQLLDSEGRLRGLFTVSRKGSVNLALLGEDSKPRASLSAKADGGSHMIFYDAEGTVRLTASLTAKDENAALMLNDGDGVRRVMVSSSPDEAGAVTLFDLTKRPAALLGLSTRDTPVLELRRGGEPGVSAAVNNRGQGSISVKDPDGKVTWEVGR